MVDGEGVVVPDGLLVALRSLRDGNFSYRITPDGDVPPDVASVFNEIAARNARLVSDLTGIRETVGQHGRHDERLLPDRDGGGYTAASDAVNGLIEDLTRPIGRLNQLVGAVAR